MASKSVFFPCLSQRFEATALAQNSGKAARELTQLSAVEHEQLHLLANSVPISHLFQVPFKL
eukprot:3405666-Amphidinium_carterae.1